MKNLLKASPFVCLVLTCLSVFVFSGCNRMDDMPIQNVAQTNSATDPATDNVLAHHNFTQTNLVSDINDPEYLAKRIDVTLVNSWGMAVNPNGPIWIASEGSGKSQVYDKNGNQLRTAVTVPGNNPKMPGHPAGIVYNGTYDFVIPGTYTPAKFIYAGTDGVISAWAGGNNATKIADNGPASIYTGLTMGNVGSKNYLYAANLAKGTVDVWNKNFHKVNITFTDPKLPAEYGPFNIRLINHLLYVAYAKVDPVTHDELHAKGLGLIDIFKPNGEFVKRLTSFGTLNAPWGMAIAPHGTAGCENALLVGNFGDGRINVFDDYGNFRGQLKSKGMPLKIEGIWALETNVPNADPQRIYFTAGIDDESHGLFGYIVHK